MTLKELVNSNPYVINSNKKYWITGYFRDNCRLGKARVNIKPTLVGLRALYGPIIAISNGKYRCKFDRLSLIPSNYPYSCSDKIQFFCDRNDAVRYYNKSIDESIDELYNNYLRITKNMELNKIQKL